MIFDLLCIYLIYLNLPLKMIRTVRLITYMYLMSTRMGFNQYFLPLSADFKTFLKCCVSLIILSFVCKVNNNLVDTSKTDKRDLSGVPCVQFSNKVIQLSLSFKKNSCKSTDCDMLMYFILVSVK